MKLFQLTANRIWENCYILVSDNGEGVLIDPGCEAEHEEAELLRLLHLKTSHLSHILLTHAHVDHICGCSFIKKHYPEATLCAHADALGDYSRANAYGPVMGFSEKNYPSIDQKLSDGDEIHFGSDILKVIHTPGHAEGCVCYFQAGIPALFSGDTLFCQSVGRCDLPGGNSGQLTQSLRKIATLPAETRIYPGHGEATDLYFELQNNPYLYNINGE